jgi:hypothetical protein
MTAMVACCGDRAQHNLVDETDYVSFVIIITRCCPATSQCTQKDLKSLENIN